MAFVWQTIEEAAVTLRVSTRTLHRRISGGDLQTRLENGRREVMVCLPDSMSEQTHVDPPLETQRADARPPLPTPPSDMAETDTADNSAVLGAVRQEMALALSEERTRRAELALTAYQHSINIAEDSARRARMAGYFAWGTTGILVAAIIFATAWTTQRVTRAQTEMEHLTNQVRDLTEMADSHVREIQELQRESHEARIAARVSAELATPPATQPATLMQRLTSMFQE